MKTSKLEFIFHNTALTMEEYRREAKDMGFVDEERLYFVLSSYMWSLA